MLVAVVAALAIAGAILGVHLVSVGTGNAPSESARPTQQAPTSFGVVDVASVDLVAAPATHSLGGSLGGQTHGGGLISSAAVELDIALAVTNTTRRPVPVSLAQFRLRVGAAARLLLPSSATIQDGLIGPHAAVEGRLTFVAPRAARRLALEFRDRGGARPVVIDLRPAAPLAAAAHGHAHG